MKKLFKFAMVAFAAAAVVACGGKDDPETPDNKPEDKPEDEKPVDKVEPVQGESAWSVIGALLDTNWDTDFVCAQEGDIFVLKNVELKEGNEFKFRENKDWGNNRGGDFVALGEGFAVTPNGPNIKGITPGIYDLYYNAALEQAAVVAKNGTPTWAEPQGVSFNYVMDIHDCARNSEFHFTSPFTLNPAACTMQWKFFSTEWNKYDTDREGYGHVWCNRLGQLSNSQEQGYLLRFNDGGKQGQLRFNSKVFGEPASGYVTKDGEAYIWSLNEWHVLTIVADGTNVSIYDNADLVMTYAETIGALYTNGLPFERFDISMTWDDGTRYDRGQAFFGYIAYTRLWNKALTAEEVAAGLCDVTDKEGLEVYWAWNNEEGTAVANLGSAAGYDLDFTKALAGGQQSYVSAEAIEGAWTDVNDVEGLAPVCAAE